MKNSVLGFNLRGRSIPVEDKKMEEKTAQTTVASTDSVMLQGTDGSYHAIRKDSFMEAVRGAMGEIVNGFNKGTSVKSVLGIDVNNDLGTVTTANLAQVLGVLKPKGLLSINANSIFIDSVYCVYGNANVGTPTAYGILITIRSSEDNYGYWGCQLFLGVGNDCFYYRYGLSGSYEYSEWIAV